jgi:phospholipid/cholesterol/gamma-HCH transport system permease protein
MSPFSFLADIGNYTHFALRTLLALPGTVLRPRELVLQFYQTLLGALPLTSVAGVAVGVVLALQLHNAIDFVAGNEAVRQYLPQAQVLAVVLEFAPLIAGLIVAGRLGASIGAEIGSMRLTEQIDALEMLGASPLRILVAPRVLAAMLALPVLTVFTAYLAILSGYVTTAVQIGTSWAGYREAFLQVLTFSMLMRQVIPATLKTVVFGYLVSVTGCYYGMNARGGTEGVGQAATRGVVGSIFLVLVSNVFLVRLIQMIA